MPQLEGKSNDEKFDKIIVEVEQADVEGNKRGNLVSYLLRLVAESIGVWAEGRGEADDCRNDQKDAVSQIKE